MIEIRAADIFEPDAAALLQELNTVLANLTGCSGASSFDTQDVTVPRSAFVIACSDGQPVGCGALRPYDTATAELKRIYARTGRGGIGTAILQALETRAIAFGYTTCVLETRRINTAAVNFYLHSGYCVCPNYGKYHGRDEAICFRKELFSHHNA